MEKANQFMGIKARTTIYTITPVVISVALICLVLFISLFNSQRRTAGAELQYIGSKYASAFENIINGALDYVSIVAGTLELYVREGTTGREEMQKMVWNIFDNYGSIYASNIYFEPNMYDGRDADYAGTQFGTTLSGRIGYYFSRMDGKTVCMPEALQDDIEFTLPNYVEARALNAPVYTEPTVYNIDGADNVVFVISYPVRNPNNEFIGTVSVNIHLGDIYAQLQTEKIYETGYIVIANDKDRLIYTPRFEDIGRTWEDAGFRYTLPLDTEEAVVLSTQSSLNGKDVLVAIETVYFPRLDSHFYISVMAPFGEINARGARLIVFVVTFVSVVMILIALALYYLIGKLLNPLKEFKEAADTLSRGDYSVRITGDYRDEFGVLKDTVNSMIKSIESYMEDSKKSLRILGNILNGINACMYVTIPSTGKILFINQQMKGLFNIKRDVVGEYCYKILQDGFDKMCEFCPCYKLDKDPNTPVIWEELNTITKRYYRNTDCYIDWLDGEKVHLQHSVDITDIKKITEEKLQAQSEALEFARKKEQAEELSRAKSVFLASMSHEIRTPMHGIIGFSELALDDNIPPKTKNYLEKIKASAESLLLIINDVLDVSKIESGKMELERIPFEMSEVFKLCRMIASPRAREKGLTLFCYSEPSIGRLLLGDPTRLRQILLNLLSNAIKFTNSGVVKLLSAITEKTESTITMHFEVKDSGIGMTEEQISKIFQPFVQADDSTTRKYGGTGLGLTITKNFVELMGGELKVESVFGVGSKFSFDITFETIDSNSSYPGMSVIVNIDEKPVFEAEILVCEDNSINQMVISDHLSKVGIKTIIAENGRIGVDLVKGRMEKNEKPFDLIFMDIHMPEMDGLDAAKILIEAGSKTPIVALTANVMTNDKEMYLTSGMCDCLPKPFVAHELWTCLLKFLRPISTLSIKKDNDFSEEEDQRMELITAFVKGNQTTVKDINSALEAGDVKLAHRLAHTLKGVAGLVGKPELSQAALAVEQSLAEGKTEFLNEQMSALENELNAALDELTALVNDYTGRVRKENPDESFNNENALKLLEKLDLLLEADSIDSLNLVNELNMIHGMEQLASQVENLNFKQARETLAAARQQMENENENENGQS